MDPGCDSLLLLAHPADCYHKVSIMEQFLYLVSKTIFSDASLGVRLHLVSSGRAGPAPRLSKVLGKEEADTSQARQRLTNYLDFKLAY